MQSAKVLLARFTDMLFPFLYRIHEKKFTESIVKEISGSAYILSPLETLSAVSDLIKEKKTGAYMRFGDGDVLLSIGKNDSYQQSGKKLSAEMEECFSLKGPNIIKSLSIHSKRYGYEKEMYPGNHLVTDTAANELLQHVYPFFAGYKILSPVALHYAASYHPAIANHFLKLLKSEAILFIGNENIPNEIVRKLFGDASHVKAPAKNSFDKIDSIEKEAEDILKYNKKYGVVIIAMGCSGRILAKRLYKKNYDLFLFDFGSLLDGICGNNTRTWLQEVNINYKELLKDL